MHDFRWELSKLCLLKNITMKPSLNRSNAHTTSHKLLQAATDLSYALQVRQLAVFLLE